MSIRIERVDASFSLANQPFEIRGRLAVTFDGAWHWREELTGLTEMTFPEEPIPEGSLALAAFEGEQCLGLAVLRDDFFRYMYLHDLKVNRDCRGKGVGRRLIEAAVAAAKERGYRGIRTICQDNNLDACLFYLACGFVIGGLDTMGYRGTPQEGKKDIRFYLDLPGEEAK